jgi:hypothetical protein
VIESIFFSLCCTWICSSWLPCMEAVEVNWAGFALRRALERVHTYINSTNSLTEVGYDILRGKTDIRANQEWS